MAVVHLETNRGTHADAALHKNRTPAGAAHSNGDVEPSTIEINVEFAEARDVIVIAVTADKELRTALRAVLPSKGLIFAESPEQLLSRRVPSNCGVLIVEQTLSSSTFDRLKSHLKESAPALVSIMIGTSDNGSSLVARLSAGHIDRFIVKPLKRGPTRSALRSALQQHHSLRQCAQVERTAIPELLAIERLNAKQWRGGLEKGKPDEGKRGDDLQVANDEVVESSRETRTRESTAGAATPRRLSLAASGIAFAAVTAVIAFGALVFAGKDTAPATPGLNKDKVIAGHLAAAHRAFEIAAYIDPPELNAAHFYAAALELDPMNIEAKRGLNAVADRLLADGKELIVAGDLLRAQSILDNVKRIEPHHRELSEVTASLLTARDAERVTLQAARSATKESPDAGAALAQVAPLIDRRAPVIVETKVSNASPRSSVAIDRVDASSSSKSFEKVQHANATDSSLRTLASSLVERATEGRLLANAQNEDALPVPNAISTPRENPTDAQVATEVPGIHVTSSANPEPILVKYVAPEYPHRARVDNVEGWLDVHFLVTSDGSVIRPQIEKNSLDPAFRRAALAAVTQWKYSPSPTGATPPRPMLVRVKFQIEDSKRSLASGMPTIVGT